MNYNNQIEPDGSPEWIQILKDRLQSDCTGHADEININD